MTTRPLTTTTVKMAPQLYTDETPAEVKNAKGLHLLTMNTPNGQAVQIFLEELKDAGYDVDWTTTLIDIMTNDQKKVRKSSLLAPFVRHRRLES